MRVRFTIAGLMIAVVVFAVGLAGLRAASPLWASAVFTITVTLLTTAILGAAACRGRPRVAWLGFSVFGWTYLLATFWLWPGPNGVTAPPFLTKAILDSLEPQSQKGAIMTFDPGPVGEQSTESPPMVATFAPGPGTTTRVVSTAFTGRVVNLLHYRRIGHTLAAIAFGLLGAVLGALFSARSPDKRRTT